MRAYISNASNVGLRHEDLDDLVNPWTGSEGQTAFYRQIIDYDERYLRENEDLLAKLTVPVHIVWGEQDAVEYQPNGPVDCIRSSRIRHCARCPAATT